MTSPHIALIKRLEVAAGLLEEFNWEDWPNLDYPPALMMEAADLLQRAVALAQDNRSMLFDAEQNADAKKYGWTHYAECLDGCGRLRYGGDTEWAARAASRHMHDFENHRASVREVRA